MKFKNIYCFITNKCNNRCLICLNSEQMKKNIEELELYEFKQLLNSIPVDKGDLISISGGEPTLHGDLQSILKFIRENYNNQIKLVTNARALMDLNFIESIEPYIDHIITSLFGITPKNHKYITQCSKSYEETIKGLQNAEKLGIKLHIRFIPLKYNINEIPQLVPFIIDNFQNPRIIINALNVVANAEFNKEVLLLKYSNFIPNISKAIDDASSNDLQISIHFPLCLFDPYYWNYFSGNFKTMYKKSYVIMKRKTYIIGQKHKNFQPKSCKTCIFKNRCMMLGEGYVNLYGENEIKPINQYSSSES